MISNVEVANLCFSWLGRKRISSFDDPTQAAQSMKDAFAITLALLCEEAEWSFALDRRSLLPAVGQSVWGGLARFEVPGDVARVLMPRVGESQFTKEGNFLLADPNVGKLDVRVLVKKVDLTGANPSFAHALAARLAADLAIGLTENSSLGDKMWLLYERKLREAKFMDNSQSASPAKTNSFAAMRHAR